MTKDEFIAKYCKDSNVTWDYLKDWRVALPCYCGDDICLGWAMISPSLADWHMKTDGVPRDATAEPPA